MALTRHKGLAGQALDSQTGGLEPYQAEALQGDVVQVISPVKNYPGGVEFEYINTSGQRILYQEFYTATGPAFNTYVIGGAAAPTTSLAGVQAALDVAGFIPGIGIAADVLNAGIYAYRGNYGLAAISAVGAVPIVGDAFAAVAKGAKVAKGAELAQGGTYLLRNPSTGQVMRTGRSNDLLRRGAEHGRDPNFRDFQFEPVHRTDVYSQQRGLEQLLHDTYNPPLNFRRPISPTNPNRPTYLDEAQQFLQRGNP